MIVGSLDTNIILRLLVGDVPSQTALAEQLIDATDGQLAVADLAVIELEYVLRVNYKFTRAEIADLIEGFLLNPKINSNKSLFAAALPLYLAQPKQSLTDCLLAMYADLNQALPLWTFDKKLALQSDGRAQLLE